MARRPTTKKKTKTAGKKKVAARKVASKKSATSKAPTKRTAGKKTAKKAASEKTGRGVRRAGQATATPAQIGADLVRLCNTGQADGVVAKWYHPRIVSVEGDGQTTRGLKALAGKYEWWEENHEVHSFVAIGPYVGVTGFAVRFDIAVTPRGGQRLDLSETAVYTVRDGKIVREEFMYAG